MAAVCSSSSSTGLPYTARVEGEGGVHQCRIYLLAKVCVGVSNLL